MLQQTGRVMSALDGHDIHLALLDWPVRGTCFNEAYGQTLECNQGSTGPSIGSHGNVVP